MATYSTAFTHIMKSLDAGQFRTVQLGDAIASVREKELGLETYEGNIYMPFVEYFVPVSPETKQYFKLMYLHENDRIDHMQFRFEYREFPHGLSQEDFAALAAEFAAYLTATYGEPIEKSKARARERNDVWQSSADAPHALKVTFVTQYKPKEKVPSYLQITFARRDE